MSDPIKQQASGTKLTLPIDASKVTLRLFFNELLLNPQWRTDLMEDPKAALRKFVSNPTSEMENAMASFTKVDLQTLADAFGAEDGEYMVT